jgi:MoxR-like ATPase
MPIAQNQGATGLDDADAAKVARLAEAYTRVRGELGKRIIGQDEVIEQLLVCFFAGGHCLIIGVPGLAKTLIIRSLAEVMSLGFRRIQFTPDLMPSDITGTDIITCDASGSDRGFHFVCGPVFTNILLADEINRTPPKTQAALMEAMEEGQVTCGGTKYPLEKPFFVLATQNPIEQEGTYPLPAAQLDRFMFNINIDYPDPQTEFDIALRTTSNVEPVLETILDHQTVLDLLGIVRRVAISPACLKLAVTLSRISRNGPDELPQAVQDYVEWGSGPRAVQCMILGGKARAMLHGRYHVLPEDILAVIHPVMRHRIIPNYHAEAENVSTDAIIDEIVRFATGGEPAEGGGVLDRLREFLSPGRTTSSSGQGA